MHGPAGAGHAVAAVKSPGKEHVLGADEDRRFFWVDVPFAAERVVFLAAHEDDGRMVAKPEQIRAGGAFLASGGEVPQPLFNLSGGLLDKRPHRETINKAAWPVLLAKSDSVPQPGKDNAGGFAESRGNGNQAGSAVGAG